MQDIKTGAVLNATVKTYVLVTSCLYISVPSAAAQGTAPIAAELRPQLVDEDVEQTAAISVGAERAARTASEGLSSPQHQLTIHRFMLRYVPTWLELALTLDSSMLTTSGTCQSHWKLIPMCAHGLMQRIPITAALLIIRVSQMSRGILA